MNVRSARFISKKIWISFPISDISWHFSMRAVSLKCETYNEMPSDILTRAYVPAFRVCVHEKSTCLLTQSASKRRCFFRSWNFLVLTIQFLSIILVSLLSRITNNACSLSVSEVFLIFMSKNARRQELLNKFLKNCLEQNLYGKISYSIIQDLIQHTGSTFWYEYLNNH